MLDDAVEAVRPTDTGSPSIDRWPQAIRRLSLRVSRLPTIGTRRALAWPLGLIASCDRPRRSVDRASRRPGCGADGGRVPRAGLVRRFAALRTGAAAVEFALLAGPFLALLCVVAESGFAALAQQTLDIAVDRGVRELRTGGFQDGADGSDPSQRFRRIVCDGQAALFPCADLRLDVSRASSFSEAQPAEPFDKTKKTWVLGFGARFDCPQGGDTVTVRVAVPVIRLFRFLDFTGRTMADGSQLLISTQIFRTEAYESKSC
jgi:Flp pilus assembly protein TadG